MARIIIGICGAYFLILFIVAVAAAGQTFSLTMLTQIATFNRDPKILYIALAIGASIGFCWNLIAKESSGSE